MPIPKSGQKTIPLKDWRRFLRVADWFERTVEQGNGTRQPSYGQSLIVKTPVDGIAAAVRVDEDTTIFSATCIKCVAAETSTPGERTLHETDEELVVYNADEQHVPGEIFVKTTLSPNGTRYVDRGPQVHRITGLAATAVYYNTASFTLSGTPKIINPVGSTSDEDYTVADLIKNPYGLTFPINATVFIEWNDTDEQWEAVGPHLPANQQAGWLQFTASVAFLAGGTITINARTYLHGQPPAVDITSILNPMNLTGGASATGVAVINANVSPPTYTAFNVSPVAENVITDFRVNTSSLTLETKNRDVSIMPRGPESDWEVDHTGDDCP